MHIKKNDIEIDCEHCIYNSSHGSNDFELSVPVTDTQIDVTANATIRCRVHHGQHHLKLENWKNDDHVAPVSEEALSRLSSVLEFIAEKRLCGNQRLCPEAIIRIIKSSV
jgi:hypothetical protein